MELLWLLLNLSPPFNVFIVWNTAASLGHIPSSNLKTRSSELACTSPSFHSPSLVFKYIVRNV